MSGSAEDGFLGYGNDVDNCNEVFGLFNVLKICVQMKMCVQMGGLDD